MSPCFPDRTQFSYMSRFCGVGGISQNTCRVSGEVHMQADLLFTTFWQQVKKARSQTFAPRRMWYQTEVPPKSMWKSVKQPCTLMRQYLQKMEGMHVHKSKSNHVRTLAYSLLYFGIMHVYDGVGGVSLSFLEVSWPHVVNPVYKIHLESETMMMAGLFTAFTMWVSRHDWSSHCWSHRSWSFDQILQPGVAELQANDVVEFLSFWRWCLIVASPLCHRHLDAFLGVHVHDVHNASTACKRVWRLFYQWEHCKSSKIFKDILQYDA